PPSHFLSRPDTRRAGYNARPRAAKLCLPWMAPERLEAAMRTADARFREYGESHGNPVTKALHWVCVPPIVVRLVGLLWSLPRPAFFADLSPWLNWGTLFVAAAMLYYLLLSWQLALGMVVVSALVIAGNHALSQGTIPLWQVSLAIFVIAWIGQF